MSYIRNQFFYTRKEPIEGTDPDDDKVRFEKLTNIES